MEDGIRMDPDKTRKSDYVKREVFLRKKNLNPSFFGNVNI